MLALAALPLGRRAQGIADRFQSRREPSPSPARGRIVVDLLIEDVWRRGACLVMVTHDLDSLFTVCDRVAVLVDQQLMIGTPDSLQDHDHPWIKEYFQGRRGQAPQKEIKR